MLLAALQEWEVEIFEKELAGVLREDLVNILLAVRQGQWVAVLEKELVMLQGHDVAVLEKELVMLLAVLPGRRLTYWRRGWRWCWREGKWKCR